MERDLRKIAHAFSDNFAEDYEGHNLIKPIDSKICVRLNILVRSHVVRVKRGPEAPLDDIGMEKYGLRAFQRRIGRIHTISGHDFRSLYENALGR